MAETNEFAHYDVVIGLLGAEEVRERLHELMEKIKSFDALLKQVQKANVTANVQANDRASPTIHNIYNKLSSLTHRAWEGTISLRDKASHVIEGVKSKLAGITNLLMSPLGFIGISVAGAGLGGIVKESLEVAGSIEQTQVAFESMLKSRERATKLYKELQKYAIETPFNLENILNASKLLLAFGYDAEKVIDTLRILGDTASALGLGGQGLERFAYALGDIRAKAKLEEMDLRQLQTAGVPALRYLQEGLNLSTVQIQELITKGLIPSNLAIHLILKGMERDFGGLTKRQSKTLLGIMSNLQDFVRLGIFENLGRGIKDSFPLLAEVTDMLMNNDEKAQKIKSTFYELGKTIGSVFNSAFNTIIKLGKWLSSPNIQSKSWEEKIQLILESIVNKITTWIEGPGGKFLLQLFTALGKIVIQGFLGAIKFTLSEAFKVNFLNSLIGVGITAGIANKLGLTKLFAPLAKLFGKGGKALFEAGKSQGAIIEQAGGVASKVATAGKVAGAIGLGIQGAHDVVEVVRSENKPQKATEKATAWGLGLAGAKTGATLGATIGTAIAPGIGTGIGTVVGSVAGWFGGYKGGEALGSKLGAWLFGNKQQTTQSTKTEEVVKNAQVNKAENLIKNIETNRTERVKTTELKELVRNETTNRIEKIQIAPEIVNKVSPVNLEVKGINELKKIQEMFKNLANYLRSILLNEKSTNVIKETSKQLESLKQQSSATRVLNDVVNRFKELSYQERINKLIDELNERRRQETIQKQQTAPQKTPIQETGRLFIYAPQIQQKQNIYNEMAELRPISYRRQEPNSPVKVDIGRIAVEIKQEADKESIIQEVTRQFNFAFRRALENAV